MGWRRRSLEWEPACSSEDSRALGEPLPLVGVGGSRLQPPASLLGQPFLGPSQPCIAPCLWVSHPPAFPAPCTAPQGDGGRLGLLTASVFACKVRK